MEQTAYLILENGTVFEGKSFGAAFDVTGELVFTTAMTGYLATLTDPSYYGQIVVQTFPLIGNYGVIPAEFESQTPRLKAYIVRDWCQEPSNFRCEGNLDTFLKEKNIPGLYGIDTRALTRIVREYGVMNARITMEKPDAAALLPEIKAYKIKDAVKTVTSQEVVLHEGKGNHRVVLWDFGAKENIEKCLLNYGCEVICVPSFAKAEEILSYQPEGVMLSNGPGDPAENVEIIEELKKLCAAKIPIMGICLGHQLLALANGAKTEKMKYGHRGANQPAVELATGKVFITSQNHGYAVINDSLPAGAEVSFINANDGTCEGVNYHNIPAFSVQFHPEACGGPLDTMFLFEKFMTRMEEEKICR